VLADLRREYQLGRDAVLALDAVEFCALVIGVSPGSRLALAVGAEVAASQRREAPPATVETASQYLERLRRRGVSVKTGGEQ
jgi:hypothetical protein